ncbi:hypothetical protein DPMN_091754 [Dreissena polymorpha]|uniref:Uncharacterized protein n=1 Tax=Dreissena polymorpha TaxID=45954 RepID=A0A9D4L0R4_DREPO|nr:hypothetical protein DPMN_091754 [Dreissena polymorpha]
MPFAYTENQRSYAPAGNDFPKAFNRLGDMTCLFPKLPHLALTATATPNATENLIESLQFKNTTKNYSWLQYSEKTNGVFCAPFYLFTSDTKCRHLFRQPYLDCSNVSSTLKKHEKNQRAEDLIEIYSFCFGFVVDEATDAATMEQMALWLRYYVAEKALQVYHRTGEALDNAFLENLQALGVNIQNVRGQGYDGAKNMSVKQKGSRLASKSS